LPSWLWQGGLFPFGLNLGDEFIDCGTELAEISEGLHDRDFLSGWIAGGVGELFCAEQLAGGEVRVVVGEGIGNAFTDIRAKKVVDEEVRVLGVASSFWNGHVIHEKMGSVIWENKGELVILGVEQGGFATPDYSDVDVSIFQRSFWTIGIVNFDKGEPLFKEGCDEGKIFCGDIVDAKLDRT